MKKLIFGMIGCLAAFVALAETNVLQLTWMEPPGWRSTLYCSTNLLGQWTPLGVVEPPVNVSPTGQVAFFYVNVAPAGPRDYAGGDAPLVDAEAGSYFVNTNTGDWWVNVSGGTNGWQWYIEW